jgi:hypothetical protein
MNSVKDIEKKIRSLKPRDIEKINKFIDRLNDENKSRPGGKLKQDWAGVLEKFKKDWTSVELQKKANEWR